MQADPHFIVNPRAARDRAGRRWASELEGRLRRSFPGMTYAISTADRSLAELAVAAARPTGGAAARGCIVGVGGDGTHHDIVNGLAAAGLLANVTYVPFPLGSGNDWVRTLGLSRRPEQWVAQFRRARTIDHLLGEVAYRDATGVAARRVFINVAGLCYDAEVVRRAEAFPVKHRFLYPLLTVGFLKDYCPPRLRLTFDGQTVEDHFHTINFGVCRYSGGGMRLVPQADPAGKTLALTFARRLPVARILAVGWRFYTDTIGRVRGVTTTHVRDGRIDCLDGRLELEADGEWLGHGPVDVGIHPRRLRVLVGDFP